MRAQWMWLTRHKLRRRSARTGRCNDRPVAARVAALGARLRNALSLHGRQGPPPVSAISPRFTKGSLVRSAPKKFRRARVGPDPYGKDHLGEASILAGLAAAGRRAG